MYKKIFLSFIFSLLAVFCFAQSDKDLVEAANVKAAMGNYKAAVEDMEKVLKSSPTSENYYVRAMIYYHWGNKTLSDEDLQKIVSMPAKTMKELCFLGLAQGRLRDHKARDAAFNELLQQNPNSAEDCFAAALAYISMKRLSEAVSYADMAIERDPKFVKAYILKASIKDASTKKRRGDSLNENDIAQKKEALEDLKKALELSPKNDEVQMMCAELEAAVGLKEESFARFDKLIERYPENARLKRLQAAIK